MPLNLMDGGGDLNPRLGLSNKEAQKRLALFGYNELVERKKTTVFDIFIRQFRSYLIYILLFAAILSLIVGEIQNSVVISLIILFIAALGFIQEYKADKALWALKSMIIPRVSVIRGGKEREIPTRELVPGDMITLRPGNKVPADAVVVADKCLKIDESILTGESRPVDKTAIFTVDIDHIDEYLHTAGETNKLFMGTHVVNGKCAAVVTHTGMNTEFGKIAKMVQMADEEIPLQIKIEQLTKMMLFVALGISLLTFIVSVVKADVLTAEVLYGFVIIAIALAVSAIPESLPVVTTIVMALGVRRMARKNAIVRDMSAIETLGLTTVICTDKTGTLTVNEMTATRIFMNNRLYEVSGEGYSTRGGILYKNGKLDDKERMHILPLLKTGVLCNDARIEDKDYGCEVYEHSSKPDLIYPLIKSEIMKDHGLHSREYRVFGSQTEAALLVLASKEKIFKEDLMTRNVRIEEMPFSSDRKIMSVICREETDKEVYEDIMYTKGAPDVIIKKCSRIYREGRIYDLNLEERAELENVNKLLGEESLRVLAVAYKKVESAEDFNPETEEENLIFLGLVGMSDPPREEVKESIRECKRAGIRVVMITGDHRDTATTIGRELGILDKNTRVITGSEIDDLTDEELRDVIGNVTICARTKPEHKLRLIKSLEENDQIVAMTGDGVNDAPALKKAHVGIAMGTGSDVSKETSDIILIDDHFSTIVKAIKEGRTIYYNIRKFITYQLSCNFAELSVIFFGVILFGPEALPLLALQILFMNLVTDDLPAIALGFDPSFRGIMQEPPRDPKEGILSRDLIALMVIAGSVMGIGTLLVFYHEYRILGSGIEKARTMALATLIFSELFNSLNFRSLRESIFAVRFKKNMWLFYAIVGSLLSSLAVIYLPFLNTIFETVPLNIGDWVKVILTSASVLLVVELLKVNRFHTFLTRTSL